MNIWDKAYSNTKDIKGEYFYEEVCAKCGIKTTIKKDNNPQRQVLGNSIETVVYCSVCNNPFVTSKLYGS